MEVVTGEFTKGFTGLEISRMQAGAAVPNCINCCNRQCGDCPGATVATKAKHCFNYNKPGAKRFEQ